MNYYDSLKTLGLNSEATVSDIKQAYRRLAKNCHPDAGGDNKLFCDLKTAYDVALAGPVYAENSRAYTAEASSHKISWYDCIKFVQCIGIFLVIAAVAFASTYFMLTGKGFIVAQYYRYNLNFTEVLMAGVLIVAGFNMALGCLKKAGAMKVVRLLVFLGICYVVFEHQSHQAQQFASVLKLIF